MDRELRLLEREFAENPNDSGLGTRFAAALAQASAYRRVLESAVWVHASPETRSIVAEGVAERLGNVSFKGLVSHGAAFQLAAFQHEPSGVPLILVPGGVFRMGFTEEEEECLKQLLRELRKQIVAEDQPGMWEPSFLEEDYDVEGSYSLVQRRIAQSRPTRDVTVSPFLIGQAPLTEPQARHWLEPSESSLHERHLEEYGLAYDPANAGAAVSLEQARAIVEASGFRLPSEAEWEYAARGGTRSVTPWGDRLPEHSDLVLSFGKGDIEGAQKNAFGLVGLGSQNELCADTWHESYEGAPPDERPWGTGATVSRGAGATTRWEVGNEWWSLVVAESRACVEGWADWAGVGLRVALSVPVD